MAILELVKQKPDWMGALAVAMERPPGVPERRSGEDPWNPDPSVERPRRIADDLAWFRQAVDDPTDHGLQPLDPSAAVLGGRRVERAEWKNAQTAPFWEVVLRGARGGTGCGGWANTRRRRPATT